MRRRAFIAALGSAAAWPVVARGQQPAIPVIGFLNNATPESYAPFVAAFRRGLVQTGYTEGQNVTIDYRWGRNQPGQLVEAAKALVQRGVSVLVASGGNQALDAAKAATVTIPIVVTFGSDPVETGLVSSLNRPEGNLTGVSVFAVQLVAKQLQLARELAPKAQTIAFLKNPTNSAAKIGRDEIEAAGKSIGQKIVILDVATEADVGAAFTTLTQNRSGAAIVEADLFFNGIIESLVALARRS